MLIAKILPVNISQAQIPEKVTYWSIFCLKSVSGNSTQYQGTNSENGRYQANFSVLLPLNQHLTHLRTSVCLFQKLCKLNYISLSDLSDSFQLQPAINRDDAMQQVY